MVRIAVVGCLHGELDAVVAAVAAAEPPVDLVLVCGDFEALRGPEDLPTLACPEKYRRLGDYPAYHARAARCPVPLVFVGGNHEASAHLWEAYNGAALAPNIFYLGHAGVLRFAGLRIAGLSGIFKPYSHWSPYFAPYSPLSGWTRSAHHFRDYEVFRLSLLHPARGIDIFLSHEWPRGIIDCGDAEDLFRRKPFFRDEKNSIGASQLWDLLKRLRPRHWFAAHMHCRFEATVPHEDGTSTHFLALDKVLPNRCFMEIVDVEPKEPTDDRTLYFDHEWLAITASTAPLFPLSELGLEKKTQFMKRPIVHVPDEELEDIKKRVPDEMLRVKALENAERDPVQQGCDLFDLIDVIYPPKEVEDTPMVEVTKSENPEEIELDDD